MRGVFAAIAVLCLLSVVPAHARSGPDCINVMGVSGFECVSRATAPAVRHAKAQKGKRPAKVKVAGKAFTPSPVVSFHSSAAPWLADAQRYVGKGNPTSRGSLWCARFINDRLGGGTKSDLAKSFLQYPRTSPRPGAIAVYSRGKRGGHVAIVEEVNGNTVTLVSGNCGAKGVCRYTRSVGSAIAYVWPEA